MQGAGAYKGVMAFRDLDAGTLENFDLAKEYEALEKTFPTYLSKDRKCLQY